MEIIFVHHAMRKVGHPRTQQDDITRLGKKDAKIVAKFLEVQNAKGRTIEAIYTSPFLRCEKTAQIINKKIRVPIYHEERFNECGSVNNETWLEFQKRVREGLKDIVEKHDEDACVVCVMSGVNVVALMQLAFNLQPDENAPAVKLPSCSPMIFNISKSNFVI